MQSAGLNEAAEAIVQVQCLLPGIEYPGICQNWRGKKSPEILNIFHNLRKEVIKCIE